MIVYVGMYLKNYEETYCYVFEYIIRYKIQTVYIVILNRCLRIYKKRYLDHMKKTV